MPLHGDDFDFIQSATKDAMKGLIHLFAAPHSGNMILSGCQVSGSSVSSGYIVLDYEVCYFAGGALPSVVNDGAKYVLSVSYDTAGNDVFADSVARDTYEVRRAVIVDAFAGMDVATAPRLDARLSAILEGFNTQAQVVSFFNGWTASGQVFVKKLPGGLKVLYGALGVGSISSASATKVCTLPDAQYWPDGATRHKIVPVLDSGLRQVLLIFKTNGEIEAISGDSNPITTVVRVCEVYR
jgi:hypothetical protein